MYEPDSFQISRKRGKTMEIPELERNRFQMLLMAAVDGELSGEDQKNFENYLHRYPDCREEWQHYSKVKQLTSGLRFTEPSEEVWDKYWPGIHRRIERRIVWIIVLVGCTILLTYGGVRAIEALIADAQLLPVLKIGFAADIAFVVVLLVSQLLMLLMSGAQQVIVWKNPFRFLSSEPQ
jgi:hypothetical protein